MEFRGGAGKKKFNCETLCLPDFRWLHVCGCSQPKTEGITATCLFFPHFLFLPRHRLSCFPGTRAKHQIQTVWIALERIDGKMMEDALFVHWEPRRRYHTFPAAISRTSDFTPNVFAERSRKVSISKQSLALP